MNTGSATLVHQPPENDPGPPPRSPRDVVRTVASGLGQLLVTAGVVGALFLVHQTWGSDRANMATQAQLTDQLQRTWAVQAGTVPQQVVAPPVGEPFAFLRIPRLGADYSRAVVEGTEQPQLAQGPGHYVGTAMPGQLGNFAVAGHRVGQGSPFLDLDTLRPGDPIVVETADARYTYRVIGDPVSGQFTPDANGVPGLQIVDPAATSVISPTPGGPLEAAPTGAYLTLTTCHPKYSDRLRLIIHAALDGAPLPAAAPSGGASPTST